MDIAGLSPDREARSSAPHRPASTRERRGEPIAAAIPGTADQLQADYFVRLLAGQRGLIDQRIDEYQRKIAAAEANGDIDAVAALRRLVRVAEQDQQTVEALADKLCRRFVGRAPAEHPRGSPRGRLVVRR